MNVIFLDVDGVLNNSTHICKIVKMLGKEQYKQILKEIGEFPFDYRSCGLLQKLANETNSKIVLSSTWRLSEKHIEILKKYAGIEIWDKTPILSKERGYEIQSYLNEHKDIDNYLILDDDSDFLDEQKEHFIQINSKVGFCSKYYNKSKEILKIKK